VQRVSAEGGEAVTVAWPDSTRGESALRFPSFLPDGRHFLYVSLPRSQGHFDVHVGDLDSRKTEVIMSADSAPIYTEPGYLIFARDGRLVVQRFDLSRLRPTGAVIPLDDELPPTQTEGSSLLCAPARGVLLYVTAKIPSTELVWLDRAGRSMGTIPLPPGRYESPSLSPDDRSAAVMGMASAFFGDLWLVDLQRSLATRATFDGSASSDVCPWSSDGSRVAYTCIPSGAYDIYEVSTSGSRRPEPLVQGGAVIKGAEVWSPDGKYFVYNQLGQATRSDLWLLPLAGERTPVPYLCSDFNEGGADISPDGRWLAYASDETGTSEIYVQSFPEPGEKRRVSTAGGDRARWSSDGRELVIRVRNSIYSVDVQTTPTFTAGTPRRLFSVRQDVVGITATSDLQRFLTAFPVEEGASPPSIKVILNWEAALQR
jgi:Tol biopolymer transport system component